MAASATKLDGASAKSLDTEMGFITFTSTTGTVEITTYLSEIYGATFTRIGGGDPDDRGLLTIDETQTAGVISPASNAITVDRDAATGTGTLTTEAFFYTLVGKS
jgi:hypothetical protein